MAGTSHPTISKAYARAKGGDARMRALATIIDDRTRQGLPTREHGLGFVDDELAAAAHTLRDARTVVYSERIYEKGGDRWIIDGRYYVTPKVLLQLAKAKRKGRDWRSILVKKAEGPEAAKKRRAAKKPPTRATAGEGIRSPRQVALLRHLAREGVCRRSMKAWSQLIGWCSAGNASAGITSLQNRGLLSVDRHQGQPFIITITAAGRAALAAHDAGKRHAAKYTRREASPQKASDNSASSRWKTISSPNQARVLRLLARAGPQNLSLREWAERIGFSSRGAVQSVINRLERLDLLTVDRTRKRYQKVAITDAGRAAIANYETRAQG